MTRIAEAVCRLVSLILVERVKVYGPQAVVELPDVGEPFAVGRPRRIEDVVGCTVRVCVDLYVLAGGDVHVPKVYVLVPVSYLPAIGRPDRVRVEGGAAAE